MARQEIIVTQAWVQVASGQAVITIEKRGTGTLRINDQASDTAANRIVPALSDQIKQTSAQATWMRSDENDWHIVVDGAL